MQLRNYPQSYLLAMFFNGVKAAFNSLDTYNGQKKIGKYEKYRQTAYYLKRKGLVSLETNRSGERFLKLTGKGQLELLLLKAGPNSTKTWDGKWRIIFFDIPETVKNQRQKLRKQLLSYGFLKMQASAYVSPYSLNREAIDYLKKTGLIEYIRIGKLEELDDDRDLRKHFHL